MTVDRQIPSADAFAAAARRVYERGVDGLRFAEAEFLLDTHLLDAKAADEAGAMPTEPLSRIERERLARAAIADVIEGMGVEAQLLFGAHRKTRRQNRSKRCTAAARHRKLQNPSSGRHYAAEHAPRLTDELGKTLYALELRTARHLAGARVPVPSIALEWLRRHEYYSDLWTAVYALQADLIALIAARARGDMAAIRQHTTTSIYWWGLYWLGMVRFREDCAGLVILADGDAAQAADDALYAIGLLPGVSQDNQSWLRMLLRDIPHQELHDFARRFPHHPEGKRIMADWEAWLDRCSCDHDGDPAKCPLHIVLTQCEAYTSIIDTDWFSITGWYQNRPAIHNHIAGYLESRAIWQRPNSSAASASDTDYR
jgi:hypothetical protein